MQRLGRTRVYCPLEVADRLTQFVAAASRLEDRSYEYEILPLRGGDSVEVGTDLRVEAFPTEHPVPSLGYHLVRGTRRLRAEYRHLGAPELVRLKEQSVEITRVEEEAWLSYAGDTGPGVFDREPRLFQSKVLLLECTFLGSKKRASASVYGHLHLDDLVERAERFHNQVLLLHHLSRRHSVAEFRAVIDRALPGLASRVHLMVESERRNGL
jgi:ribonuclease Z